MTEALEEQQCEVTTPHAAHDYASRPYRYEPDKHCSGVGMPNGEEVPYLPELLSNDDDDGTMPRNVKTLKESVVGHKIVSVEKRGDVPSQYSWHNTSGHVITLDNGTEVYLIDTDDCCAYTDLQAFLIDPTGIDHVITGVGTTEGYTKWHIYSAAQDALELRVGWSCGNPFYYGYGFDIAVKPVDGELEWKRGGDI